MGWRQLLQLLRNSQSRLVGHSGGLVVVTFSGPEKVHIESRGSYLKAMCSSAHLCIS